MTIPVFDGHNDVLSRLAALGGRDALQEFTDGGGGALDLPKAKAGGFAGGLFAMWVPSPGLVRADDRDGSYDVPLPDPVSETVASQVVRAQAAMLLDLERQGALRICRSVAEIRAAMADGILAAVMHIEGAEAIGPDLDALDVYHAAGLRSIGPVWSRPTIFGHGVPNRFPATPDTGDGLSQVGRALIRRCNELRIVIDLSHLNGAGFRDVAEISDAPLVASHSNAHALSPHPRNLTDEQLAVIRASGGFVGVNFCTAFLRTDGRRATDVPVERVIEHIDYLLEKLGEDHVGLGSDYDGALVPEPLRTAADLGALRDGMAARGYDAVLIAKVCHENLLSVLERTWGG